MNVRRLAICLLLVLPLSPSGLAADELPSWTSIGPDGGNVQALAVSPVLPNWVLAGLQQGYGIFKSTNRGGSWGAASDSFGRSVLDLAINANGEAFYAATHQGLFKSTDGGALWTQLDGNTATYLLVAAHPGKPAIVLANWGGALVRSTNGGITREVIEGPEEVAKIAFARFGRRIVAFAGGVNGLWKSVDDGRTWTAVSLPFPSPPDVEAVAVDPADPRILYIGLRHGQKLLFKSLDGGATWRSSQRGLPVAQAGELLTVSELAVDGTNPSIVYAVVGGELFRSVNGGRTWSRPVPRLPGGSVQDLETTGYGVLAGTPAGVLLSVDRGLTWQFRTAGMVATSIVGMEIDHQEPARLYVSTGLAGVFKTVRQGRPWLRLGDFVPLPPVISPQWPTGDQPLAIDPADPNIVYIAKDNTIAKSTNGGRRWTVRTAPFLCMSFTQIALDPRKPAHVFASGSLQCLPYPNICKFGLSRDAGEGWECLGFAQDPILFLGIDPFTSALYARSIFGDFLHSTDEGQTWITLSSDLLANHFAASPLVEGTLWAGQGNTVARSGDGGLTWQFFAIELPSGDGVAALVPDPADPATLYAATGQSGVFKSTDAGETWSQAGLWPPGILYQGGLRVDPSDPAVVYAGTNSLGVLRLDQSGS